MEGIVKAICISSEKGTAKFNQHRGWFVKQYGIEGDAHAGNWHRQVSLLSFEKVEEFRSRGANVKDGDFGENLLVQGIDFAKLPVGTILTCRDVVLRISQIGKKCHHHCKIYESVGACIMPAQGVFAVVLEGGEIQEGDVMNVALPKKSLVRAAVLTLSDKGFAGERTDESGPKAVEILACHGYEVVESSILPDEQKQIEEELIRLCDVCHVDLIVTTGGTGFSVRDCTPEATIAVADRLAPGIAEYIRMESMKITKRAMLSRAVSAIRGKTLIVNLPGSVKAVEESLGFVIDEIAHGIAILKGTEGECGRGKENP